MAQKIQSLDSFESVIRTCTNCDTTARTPAISFCQTCTEFLCQKCLEIHSKWKTNSDHDVTINVEEVKYGIAGIRQDCKINHPREGLPCVSRSCKKNICSECNVQALQEAKHVAMDEADTRNYIVKLLEAADMKIKTVQEHAEFVDEQKEKVIEAVESCRDDIEKAHEEALARLESKRIALLDACERQEDAMLDSLGEVVDRDTEMMSSLTSACMMTGRGAKDLSRKGRGL